MIYFYVYNYANIWKVNKSYEVKANGCDKNKADVK